MLLKFIKKYKHTGRDRFLERKMRRGLKPSDKMHPKVIIM